MVREGIARALVKKWARSLAWDGLLEAYRNEPNLSNVAPPGEIGAPSGPKVAMADAISTMATPSDLDTLIELISNPSNGPSRIMLIRNLSRSRAKLAFETLVRLKDDPDLKLEIEHVLKAKLRRQAKKSGPAGAKH